MSLDTSFGPRTVQLRRIARLRYGDALPEEIRRRGDVEVFASGGAVGTHDVANTDGPVIVIGRKGSYGSVHWSASPVFVIDTAYALDRVERDCDLRWLYYVLRASNLRALSQDVGVPGLSRDRVHELRVPLIEPAMQRRIAAFLDRECARIGELENELVSTAGLLTMSAGRAGADVFAEFGCDLPDDVGVRDAWGPLPRGWRLVLLGRCLRQLTNGYVGPTRDLLVDEGIPYIQSTHIKDGRIDFGRRPYYVPPDWHRARPRINLRPDDLLIVQTGKLGEVALVPDDFGEASCHALLIARAEPSLTTGAYLAAWFSTPFGRQSLLRMTTGALHPHLEAGEIRKLHVLLPLPEVQSRFTAAVGAEHQRVRTALRELDTFRMDLLEYRDALIAEAVQGGLDVTQVSEALMEDGVAALREGQQPGVLA